MGCPGDLYSDLVMDSNSLMGKRSVLLPTPRKVNSPKLSNRIHKAIFRMEIV